MHRLLVLSGLATAILTFPAFAGASLAIPTTAPIGPVICGHAGARPADHRTLAGMAAAAELSLRLPGNGTAVRQA